MSLDGQAGTSQEPQQEIDWVGRRVWRPYAPTGAERFKVNHLRVLIKDYPPTKFEASGEKAFLSYQLHKVRGDRHTGKDRLTDMCKAICPSFFEGGHNQHQLIYVERVWSLLTSIEMDSLSE